MENDLLTPEEKQLINTLIMSLPFGMMAVAGDIEPEEVEGFKKEFYDKISLIESITKKLNLNK